MTSYHTQKCIFITKRIHGNTLKVSFNYERWHLKWYGSSFSAPCCQFMDFCKFWKIGLWVISPHTTVEMHQMLSVNTVGSILHWHLTRSFIDYLTKSMPTEKSIFTDLCDQRWLLLWHIIHPSILADLCAVQSISFNRFYIPVHRGVHKALLIAAFCIMRDG